MKVNKNKYIEYLKYLIRHKWFVMIECFKIGLIWRGLIHDLSKFLPDEFIPYAQYFYSTDEEKDKETFQALSDFGCHELAPYGYYIEDRFNLAWLKHIHRNKHHWQYWLLREDDGESIRLPMGKIYLKEMICDWIGAGKARGFKSPKNDKYYEVKKWYKKNSKNIKLRNKDKDYIQMYLKNESKKDNSWGSHLSYDITFSTGSVERQRKDKH